MSTFPQTVGVANGREIQEAIPNEEGAGDSVIDEGMEAEGQCCQNYPEVFPQTCQVSWELFLQEKCTTTTAHFQGSRHWAPYRHPHSNIGSSNSSVCYSRCRWSRWHRRLSYCKRQCQSKSKAFLWEWKVHTGAKRDQSSLPRVWHRLEDSFVAVSRSSKLRQYTRVIWRWWRRLLCH